MLKFYANPTSTYCAKVRIALEVKGVDYETVPPPGGHGAPEFLKIVPMGTIPAIQDGEFILSESDVVIEYLDEIYPEPTLLPGDAKARAHQRFLSRFHDLWLEPHLRDTFIHGRPAELDPNVLASHLDGYQARLRQLDTLIDPKPFMASETIGIADCAFPGTFTFADILLPHLGRESTYGPNLQAWRETAYQHPAVKKATDESGRATLDWIARLKV